VALPCSVPSPAAAAFTLASGMGLRAEGPRGACNLGRSISGHWNLLPLNCPLLGGGPGCIQARCDPGVLTVTLAAVCMALCLPKAMLLWTEI
jgi:hypothetical protein